MITEREESGAVGGRGVEQRAVQGVLHIAVHADKQLATEGGGVSHRYQRRDLDSDGRSVLLVEQHIVDSGVSAARASAYKSHLHTLAVPCVELEIIGCEI